MIDSVMMKTAYVQSIIRLESVCVDDAVRLNLLLNDRHQRFCAGVRDYGRVNLATAF